MIDYEKLDMISIIRKYIDSIERFEFDGGSKINKDSVFKKAESNFIPF